MGQDSRPNSSDLVIIEDVVSGPGLGNCFRFLTHQDATPTALDSLGDEELPAAVASRALGGDEAGAAGGAEEERLRAVCKDALRLWLGCFVGELRAASLRFLPAGGLFLAGGVSTKLMPMLGDHLREVFAAEPANAELLATIPIFLVDDGADVGLVGARVRARRELRHGAEGSAL